MHRSIPFAAIAATLLSAVAVAAPEETARPFFDLPHAQRTLDNGLVAIVVRTPQKGLVSVQIPVQTGSRNEIEKGKSGFAHFFEHMMFRGTPKHPAAEYGAAMQAAGADQNAFTSADWTNYYVNVTPADLDRVLELEADRFQNLAYSEEQFRTEALAVKGEYLKNYANPLLKGYERLQALAFQTHTYGHTTMGYLADIEDMPNQLEYSRTFFQRWYKPEFTAVMVVGDVELEPTMAMIERHFGGWKRGDHTQQVPAEPAQDAPRYAHVEFAGPTQPWLIAAWKAPAFTTAGPESVAQALIAEAYFGPSSPLYQEIVVRERWADQLSVQPARSRDPDLFEVAVRLTSADATARVVAAIDRTVLAARAHALDARRFDETRKRLKYGFASSFDSAARTAVTLASFVQYERDLGTLNRWFAALDALTAEQARAVAESIFADRNRNVVSIAKAASLPGADAFARLDARLEEAKAGPPPAPVAPPAPLPADAPSAPARPMTARERAFAEGARGFDADQMRFAAPVIEQRSDSPLVDVAVVFRTGAAADPPGKKGLAALTASLMAQGGTRWRSYADVQRALYPLAATLNVQVDKEMVRFYGTVHRDNADAWWKIVGEQIHSPGFLQEDLDRVRAQQIAAIRTSLRAGNDEELAKELLYQESYGAGHPYGTLTLGDASDLAGITREDVRRFFVANFARDRAILGFAGGYGDVFVEEVLASLARLPRSGVDLPKAAPAAKARARSALIVRKPTPGVAVSFGVPLAVRRGDPDWLALWVARSWLGEHRNASGRLYDRIREARGMNYGNYAYVEYFPNGMYQMRPEPNLARANDLFQVWLRPLRDDNDAVFATRVAVHELQTLVERGMTPADFERTRGFLRKFVANLAPTQAAQLGYAIDGLHLGTGDFAEYVRRGLDGLDADKVNAALRKHVDLRGIRFVYVSADADGLSKLLASGAPTPVKYNTAKPAELVAEDRRLQALPLGLAAQRIRIVDEAGVFE
jgi:zinc protease